MGWFVDTYLYESKPCYKKIREKKMVFLFRVRIPVNCKNFKLFFADDDINSGDHTEPWWSVDTLPP